MLLPADCACAEQGTSVSTRTREKQNEIHGSDFRHSEEAQLRPEVTLSNMALSLVIVRNLDARSSAAAGRKLALAQGLGREIAAKIKRQGLFPALWYPDLSVRRCSRLFRVFRRPAVLPGASREARPPELPLSCCSNAG